MDAGAQPQPGVGVQFTVWCRRHLRTNAWAVGSYFNGTTPGHSLIERWNGIRWTQVRSPNPGANNNALSGVTATSATSAWAVGYYVYRSGGLHAQTLIAHWNGTQWAQVPSPNLLRYNTLNGVATASATSAWAVGNTSDGGTLQQTLVAHWDGTRWTLVPSPSPSPRASTSDLFGVAATSTTNAWAVGDYVNSTGGTPTLIEHWNGTRWTQVPSPSPGANSNGLSGVTATTATNAWAVGFSSNDGIHVQNLALHCC